MNHFMGHLIHLSPGLMINEQVEVHGLFFVTIQYSKTCFLRFSILLTSCLCCVSGVAGETRGGPEGERRPGAETAELPGREGK